MKYELVVDATMLPDLADIHPDAPLAVAEAVWLPELGGRISERNLRDAIVAGMLPAERHGRQGGRIYVTRRGIGEWRSACRAPRNPQDLLGHCRRCSAPRYGVG